MSILRVITPCVVVHPETKAPFALKPNEPFEDTDPVVKAFRWAFGSDVEQASANPGQRRNR
jgi:hypothetical protein